MLQFSGLSGECNISFYNDPPRRSEPGELCDDESGEFSGDDPASVRMNRQLLSDAMGISPERIFCALSGA